MKEWFFYALLTGQVNLATAPNYNHDMVPQAMGELGRCIVQVLEKRFVTENESKAVTELLEQARSRSVTVEKLVGYKNQCEEIVAEIDRKGADPVESAKLAKKTATDFPLQWLFNWYSYLTKEKTSITQVRLITQGIEEAQASAQTKQLMDQLLNPVHDCGVAQLSGYLIGFGGKGGAVYCGSTTGDRWLEVNLGAGWVLTQGVGAVHVGGGKFQDKGTGHPLQMYRTIAEGRAIGTAGLTERVCIEDDERRCQYGDVRGMIYDHASDKRDIVNMGLGFGISTSAKFYNLRLKLIPLTPDIKSLGRFLRKW